LFYKGFYFNMLRKKYLAIGSRYALVAAAAALGTNVLAEAPLDYENTIRPLMEKYCIDCHDGDVAKGDLNIDRFKNQNNVLDSLAVWQRMSKRIADKSMPPSKKKSQPSEEERRLLTQWIGGLDVDTTECNHIASEESVAWYRGDVMSRRMNRFEYETTVHDLLGIDVPLAEDFPTDGAGGEGFDNMGGALYLSAIQMEKYLRAADIAVETALPLNEQGFATGPNAERLITARPAGEQSVREVAATVVRDFTYRAWRKPPPQESLDGLLDLVDSAVAGGESFDAAIKKAMKAALVSPHFIFLAEPHPPEKGNYELGGYELATRISYFLWSSMPDDELLAAAEAGKLSDPNEITAQIKRMMADPKAMGFAQSFGGQWMGISQLGETKKPDPNLFPQYSDALAQTMQEEAYTYFNGIIQEDRSLLELITSDYVFANEELAALYGLEGVTGPELRRVQVADARRGGVLGMAAVLTSTSHSLRTSPVLRGMWVMERILGEHVPPPPPNVPSLPEDGKSVEGLTFRQQLEVHREKAECAGCHSKMDPLGFGLENFDPIGRWRDTQDEHPVDASGVLPSGDTFVGPEELKGILMKQKNQFARNLSKKMLGYALGRSLNRYDTCVINDGVEALKESDYKPSALINTIVLSYPFRHRYSSGHG
jgi:hypothetical protein